MVAGGIGGSDIALKLGGQKAMHPATQGALGKRATQAGKWMHLWARRLEAEMRRQNIEPFQSGRDDSITVSVIRGEIRQLIRGMYDHALEIGRFSN
jgi:hypothetical protein